MQPLPIVEHLDELKHFRLGFLSRVVVPPMHQLILERSKKRGWESLLIVSFVSGAHHPHRSGAGSVVSRLIRFVAKQTQWCLCG